MKDPVLLGDGHTYERKAITAWMSNHTTSPMTNARLTLAERSTWRPRLPDSLPNRLPDRLPNRLPDRLPAWAASAHFA